MWRVRYGPWVIYDPRDPALALHGMSGRASLSKAGTFSFSMPPSHPFAGRIECLQKDMEVVVEEDGEVAFCGRAMTEEPGFDGCVAYTCEGERAYLNDVTLPPYSTAPSEGFVGETAPSTVDGLFAWYVEMYNARASRRHRMVVGTNDGALLDPNNHVLRESSQRPSVWSEIREKIVVPLGGHVRVRHERGRRVIDLLADGGKACAQRVELGSNLLGYGRKVDWTGFATRVVPLGKDAGGGEVTIAPLPDGELPGGMVKRGEGIESAGLVSRYGVVERVVAFEAATPEGLLSAGRRHLAAMAAGDVMEVRAADLHQADPSVGRIRVGDYVRVTSAPHGLDGWFVCCEVPFSPGEPGASTYVLGSEHDTLTRQQEARMAALDASLGAAVEAVRAEMEQVAVAGARVATNERTGVVRPGRALEMSASASGVMDVVIMGDAEVESTLGA